MNRLISRLTSLSNFKTEGPLGQVATVLILIISAVLVFTLVVANIGEVSKYATKTSIAADSAALLYASQIGTKSTLISAQLCSCGDCRKCCVKTGLAAVVIAVICAIIVTIATWGMAWYTIILAATAAGAVGGAIGGAIAGTGVMQGAIQGAIIGACIGIAATGAAGTGAEFYGAFAEYLSAAGITVFECITVAASLGVALTASASIYNASVQDRARGNVVAEISKALNGLPETQRRRESVFFQALSQTIDDPKQVPDTYDVNSDGKTTDLVPNFYYCWERRVFALKQGAANYFNDAENVVMDFQSAARNFLGAVRDFQAQIADPGNGQVMYLLRALDQAGYHPRFWVPERPSSGPNDELDRINDILGFFRGQAGSELAQNLTNLVLSWKQWVPHYWETETDREKLKIDGVVADWSRTLPFLIKGTPGPPPMLGLNGWIDEINKIRMSLPVCVYGANWAIKELVIEGEGSAVISTLESGCDSPLEQPEDPIAPPPGFIDRYLEQDTSSCDCILCEEQLPPCRGICDNPNFATVDCDMVDDFQPAISAINTFIEAIGQFTRASETCYNRMTELEKGGQANPSGCLLKANATNSAITWTWADSRGEHSITVEVGPYQEPRTIETSEGNWWSGQKCVELIHDNDWVWVSVERTDPSAVKVGKNIGQTQNTVLGRWNPFYKGRIFRKSTAQYFGRAARSGKGPVGIGWVRTIPNQ